MSESTFIQLTGLPRSGTTLLSSMLSQHPDVHVGGTSALAELLYAVCNACDVSSLAGEILQANGIYEETREKNILSVYKNYYGEVDLPFILDRSRAWVNPYIMDIVQKHINPSPKAVILIRPVEEIVASFAALKLRAGEDHDIYDDLLAPDSTPIVRTYNYVRAAVFSRDPKYLVVSYKELTEHPEATLDRVFYHYGLPPAEIDFGALSSFSVEDDSFYPYKNLHEVRDNICVRKNPLILPRRVLEQCERMTNELYLDMPTWGAAAPSTGVA
jgi:hypothetical protein